MSQQKTIKRYQNRKLYDTEASKYVTLDDIAAMIKEGRDVKVVDNKSKKDLTALTLTQIIFEEEKKHRSILPLDALKKVIRSSGESLSDIYERLIQPGLASIQSTREEIERMAGRLVKRGRLEPEESSGLVREIKEHSLQFQKKLDDSWQQMVDLVKGIAILARNVSSLEEQVESLAREIEELKKKGAIPK